MTNGGAARTWQAKFMVLCVPFVVLFPLMLAVTVGPVWGFVGLALEVGVGLTQWRRAMTQTRR